MKTLKIFLFLFISINIYGQNRLPIIIDKISYQAEELDVFLNKTRQYPTFASGTIFEFSEKMITTNNRDNTARIYLTGEWQKGKLQDFDVKYAQAQDAGGFELVVFVGYEYNSKVYFIITSYANVESMYMVIPSKFGIPKGYTPMKGHEMFNGEYNINEMTNFMSFLLYFGVDISEENY